MCKIVPFLNPIKDMPPITISLHVNGQPKRLTVDDPDMPLLYALRS